MNADNDDSYQAQAERGADRWVVLLWEASVDGGEVGLCVTCDCHTPTPIQKRKKRYKVLGQNLIKPRQHSCSIVKVLNSASEMKILQDVTDLWTMNITFYKEKLNPLSSLMTGATYWCKKQTAIVLVSDRQRNAASQKLIWLMILARYFIHVWIGVPQWSDPLHSSVAVREVAAL